MKIVGYYIGNNILATSDNKYITEKPYLDFLLNDNFQEEHIKVFYNLDYNVAQLLKTIGISQHEGEQLIKTQKTYIPPYSIMYVPKQFISIKKGSQWCYISNIERWLSPKLSDNEDVEVCKERARLASRVGTAAYTALKEIGLHPTTITSPVRAFEKEKLQDIDFPTLDDIPIDAAEYAYDCCDASWMEGYRIGHWDNVYDYDLASAYPYQLSKLLELRNGNWVQSKEYQRDAKYGYCNCVVKISHECRVSPIMFVVAEKDGYNRNYTPTGKWKRKLTKSQIDFIYHWNLGTVEIIDGYWWIPKFKDEYPFKEVMQDLYYEKVKANGNSLKKTTVKDIMSGLYGKMLERRTVFNEETQEAEKVFGQRVNPVYAAEIEVNTKLEVADFILRNQLRPVHILVDGVVSLDYARNTALAQETFGGWRLSNSNKCICIGTGVIAIKDKFKDEPETKKNFSLDYDWLMNQIRENPDSQVYRMNEKSPVTLAVASRDNGKRWSELGNLQQLTRSIYIGYDEKRMYKQVPKTGREVMEADAESFPLDVSLLQGMIK